MKRMSSCVRLPLLVLCVCLSGFSAAAIGDPVDWSSSERVVDGVEMMRLSYGQPRLMKACAMRVDLYNSTLAFTANGRDERWGRPMPGYTNLTIRTRRTTVEEFMMNARAPVELGGRGLDMVVAFNSAPWTPCPEPTPTPYGQTHGYNVSDGVVVSDNDESAHFRGVFVIWKNGRADILPAPLPPHMRGDVWLAHSGFAIVLKDGRPLYKPDGGVHPRTVVGTSRDGRWLYILAVEGRHKGVSLGADYYDLAQMMLSLGANDALNLDGGGSTTLLRWDDAAQRQVVCLQQDAPPRRNALNVGIYRRSAATASPKPPVTDDRLFETAIDGDWERSAGIYHHYEFEEVCDTPPPAGYRPFYVSHYGRHGSRYQRSEKNLNAYIVMKEAEKADILTVPGKALLQRLQVLYDAHQGMFECLAARGAEEHRRLARRLHDRFPDVFASGGKVRCQSSTYHRCLTSMANFCCSLKGVAPQLDFDFASGDACMEKLFHPFHGSKEANRKEVGRMDDALLRDMVRPERLVALLFKNTPATQGVVKDPHRFVSDLFAMGAAYQSLERELDGKNIDDFFTREERLALARYKSCKYYAHLGNSMEFGDRVIWAAKWLTEEIVERAEEAVKTGGVCADLRFGHDSGLMPLLGLLGVKGAGDRVPAAESWKCCPLWRYMPMAANLQIVLYRNDAGECLVKLLLNERETTLNGLAPFQGPYYRWADFKAHLVGLSADKAFVPGR